MKIGWFITNLFSEQNNPLLVVNTTFSDGGYIYIYATPIYIDVYIYIYTYSERFAIRSDLHSGVGSIPTSGSIQKRMAQALRRLTMTVTTPSCVAGAGATYSEKVTVS